VGRRKKKSNELGLLGERRKGATLGLCVGWAERGMGELGRDSAMCVRWAKGWRRG
jgi:hypothetical protein